MTAYFDSFDTGVREADKLDEWKRHEAYREMEGRLVYDVTLAAMLPGFPETLREVIHRIVLCYGVDSLPANTPPEAAAAYEETAAYGRRLLRMSGDLHSVFHEVGRTVPGYGDNPRTWPGAIVAQGEGQRERIVARWLVEGPPPANSPADVNQWQRAKARADRDGGK